MTIALAIWAAVQRVGAGVLAFLGKLSVWQLLLIAALIIAGVQTLRLKMEQRTDAKLTAQIGKCTAARHADQLSYAAAQRAAQAKNLATVAADKAQRERITHDISQSYESELASLRADLASRLRAPTAPAQGAAGNPGLPGVSPSPSGLDGGSRVSIPTDLYVRGAELELQLERLQQWVREQVAIDPNK